MIQSEVLDYLKTHVPIIEMLEFRSWDRGRIAETNIHESLYQIDHFVKGEGTYKIEDKEFSIKPRQFYTVPPKHKHGMQSSKDSPLQGFTVRFVLPPLLESFLPYVLTIKAVACYQAENFLRQALSEAILDQKERSIIASLRLSELIVFLIKSHQKEEGRGQKNLIVEAAVKFMQKNYSERISLDDVAKEVGVSDAYLCRLFRKEQNTTSTEVLRNIRCRYAKEMLVSTRDKVSEIARQVGFGSPQYMNRVFQSVAGLSPRSYRKKAVKKANF